MKPQPRTAIAVDTTWPKEKLMVQSTEFPNGDKKEYNSGMNKPELLPSNHPLVLAMRYQLAENEFKGSKSALRQAKAILRRCVR